MLQYKIDSDVRLDGRPCYVQEVRELPEETAHDEAPQHTARVRHDNITQAWTANGSVDVGYIGAGRAARGSPEVHRALGRAKASHTQTVSGCVAPARERGTAGHAPFATPTLQQPPTLQHPLPSNMGRGHSRACIHAHM